MSSGCTCKAISKNSWKGDNFFRQHMKGYSGQQRGLNEYYLVGG